MLRPERELRMRARWNSPDLGCRRTSPMDDVIICDGDRDENITAHYPRRGFSL